MKKFCSQSIRCVKTDKIDAVRIASFGITYRSELIRAYDAPDTYDELRFLARQYHQFTAILVKAKVNFNYLVDQVMPGISDLLQNKKENHKLTKFVDQYVHFQVIIDLGKSGLRQYRIYSNQKKAQADQKPKAQRYVHFSSAGRTESSRNRKSVGQIQIRQCEHNIQFGGLFSQPPISCFSISE